jgi:hypothetical protein
LFGAAADDDDDDDDDACLLPGMGDLCVSTLIDKIPTGSRGTIGGRGLAPEAESELLVRIGAGCWSSSDSLRVELRSTV